MNRIIWIVLLIVLVFAACKNGVQPDLLTFLGITETDENGDIIGNFDRDDWVYADIFFQNAVQINPHTEIRFSASAIGEEVTQVLHFKNYIQNTLTLTFSDLEPPFSADKAGFTLIPGGTDSVTVEFTLPDTVETPFDTLFTIFCSSNESVDFELRGVWIKPPDVPPDTTAVGVELVERVPLNYAFPAAYPNPASDSTWFRFSLPERTPVSLQIINNRNETAKVLVSGLYEAGSHGVKWDLKDESQVRVPSGIYRAAIQAGTFTAYGDIRVE